MNKPARLNKAHEEGSLEQELTISVKQLLIIFIISILFVVFCFIMQPQTFGYL